MGATKLTLRLDEELIRQAKAYARRSGKSVSRIVADYFSLLSDELDEESSELTPTVKLLRGALREAGIDEEDYRAHLERKFLEAAD